MYLLEIRCEILFAFLARQKWNVYRQNLSTSRFHVGELLLNFKHEFVIRLLFLNRTKIVAANDGEGKERGGKMREKRGTERVEKEIK